MAAGNCNRRRNPPWRCRRPTSIGDEIPTVNLPEDILIDILTRLPVKSLLKFKCVSRSWRYLISSPSFVKSHLQASEKASSSSSFTNQRILLKSRGPYPSLKDLSMRSLIEQPLIDASVTIDFPGECIYTFSVVGSDNGLICIAMGMGLSGLILWNPTTRVHTTVKISWNLIKCFDNNAIGFGYSKATDDYKVLRIFTSSDYNETFWMIYSLKDKSWKKLEGYNYGTMRPHHNSAGKLVNGKLHFTLFPANEYAIWEILAIDLDTGTQGMIEEPEYKKGMGRIKHNYSTLGVLGGCLSILFNGNINRPEVTFDLWVLKEYGVKESWTKLFTIGTEWIDEELIPLFILPTGEILLVHKPRRELAIYNPRNKSWKYPEIKGDVGSATVYVESLVSPFSNELRKK